MPILFFTVKIHVTFVGLYIQIQYIVFMSSAPVCLLVDDDLDDHEIFLLALESIDQPVNFVAANNGFEALDRLQPQAGFVPDYIFLDLNMPRMNGRQCLQEIKRQPHLQHIPVVIYSTSSAPADIENTLGMGATAFMQKPSSVADLAKALETFFATHQ